MSSSAPARQIKPPKISQTAYQVSVGIFLGIAVVVAIGRTVIRARTYKSHGFTIDDGFFLLAVVTFLAAIVITYVDIPHFYLIENATAGLENLPTDFIPYLIISEKLVDASTSLIGASIVSVKFSFLFFFRALLRRQRKMMIWWWCIFAMMIPTAILMVFTIFIICAHWNEEVFVKCATPAAYIRQDDVLKSITILDIFTDVFLISIPVLLLWNVQISLRRKIFLIGILSLSISTIIISIIRLAGSVAGPNAIDTAWVLFWYDIEAAVAIIVVSITAFRALFVAHHNKAIKYRSPAQNASTSWNFWSRKSRSARSKEHPPPVPPPPPPLPPALLAGGVRTHIRGSQYGGRVFDRGDYDLDLPLHGPGITVTQVVHTEKTPRHFASPSAESFV